MDLEEWLRRWGVVAGIAGAIAIWNYFPKSPSDFAAWVQAVASVFAIWWAGTSSRKLQIENENRTRRRAALAFVEIAESALSIALYVQRTLPDRAAVMSIVEGRARFELGDVREIERVLRELPLHDLMTPEFVKRVLVLRSAFRQLSENLEAAFEKYRSMDATDFDKFFEMIKGTKDLCQDSLDQIRKTAYSI
ncbi:hypothetical protein [Burkholderia cepacia]|uniref:hypothetical protein n=1 Tax=Burkholderia cepacia TaxID=292 RepID=UPI003D675E2B